MTTSDGSMPRRALLQGVGAGMLAGLAGSPRQRPAAATSGARTIGPKKAM